MKCPKCGARKIIATTDQVSFYSSTIIVEDDGSLDIENGKLIDDGFWWIVPDAPARCDDCGHAGDASEFATNGDHATIAETLDFFLKLELEAARRSNVSLRVFLVSALLAERGRMDLVELSRALHHRESVPPSASGESSTSPS